MSGHRLTSSFAAVPQPTEQTVPRESLLKWLLGLGYDIATRSFTSTRHRSGYLHTSSLYLIAPFLEADEEQLTPLSATERSGKTRSVDCPSAVPKKHTSTPFPAQTTAPPSQPPSSPSPIAQSQPPLHTNDFWIKFRDATKPCWMKQMWEHLPFVRTEGVVLARWVGGGGVRSSE